ncbi:MAG: excinuclease ABC subunit UvrC [Bacteroidales bacterium]|nr:excinuclease ABC subunit UvrC [Bacteroidales bacterium]
MKSGNDHINEILGVLPEGPGVYQFLDQEGQIIYVGKAKNLKKRVGSYFHKKSYESFKSKILVEKIRDIKHVVVNSESDALLLENNLIKKLQPKYNILLKDDKTFPWICIKKEPFPRIFLTRRVVNDGSKYYGPYTSAATTRTLLNLIRQLYKLRTCKYNLSEENIDAGKFRVCLEYHIENCNGPCEGLQSEQEYNESIRQIHEILKGNLQEVIVFLKREMKKLADEYQFEDAEKIKEKYLTLEKFQTKSTIVNPSINNVDVYSIIDTEKYAVVNYIKISKGAVVQAHTAEIQKRLKETSREILAFSVTDIRERVRSNAKEIILPIDLSEEFPWFRITVPRRGDKKKLLDLSERNARLYQLEKQKRSSMASKQSQDTRVLETVKKDLRLGEIPEHIECFDNSNLQGSNPVAACVVFKKGRPVKKEYRHYNIKTVKGPDDFASMEEVIFRRYRRLIEENNQIPQLIVVDGGKGQLNAAVRSLEKLNLRKKIAIIGIAKRLEEIYFPDDPVPLYIDKNSETLRLIQYLRNEAHRFGIEFHRLKRSMGMTGSGLNTIPGIGTRSVEKLYKKYGTIEKISKAPVDELSKVLDTVKAKRVKEYFKRKK